MFKVGELIKRKTVSNKPKAYCVIVDNDENNYTLYNNSLKCLQTVACVVVNAVRKAIKISSHICIDVNHQIHSVSLNPHSPILTTQQILCLCHNLVLQQFELF